MKGFTAMMKVGLVATLVGVLGLIAFAFRYLMNPVQRHIAFKVSDQQTLVDLDSHYLQEGTPKLDAESWLAQQGFASAEAEREVLSRLNIYPHHTLKGEPLDHEADAVFEGDVTSIPCSLSFTVLIDYNDEQVIETVQGFHSATGCL